MTTIKRILGSKRDDRFSENYFDLVQSKYSIKFLVPFFSSISPLKPRGVLEACRLY